MIDSDASIRFWRIVAYGSSALLMLTIATCAFATPVATQPACIKAKPHAHHAKAEPVASCEVPRAIVLPAPEADPEPIVMEVYYKFLPAPDPVACPVTPTYAGWIPIPGGTARAPEIDPAGLPAGLTLLCGLLTVIRSRK
jgi:hypothetical protein